MVGKTSYEVKHAIHIGDKEIVFAEDKRAEGGQCWFVGEIIPTMKSSGSTPIARPVMNTLFTIPDGESIVVTHPDGEQHGSAS